jgi:mono/diheme cytochrome c family protein
MMRKVLKWIGIVLGSLLGLITVAVGVLTIGANARVNKTYDVQPDPVVIHNDDDVLERGAYIVNVSCSGCHGDDLSGKAILDDPAIGYIPATNLTSGEGGIGSTYNDTDYVRAIRHGIGADGKALIIMPSKAYWHFSDADLGAIIAYLKSVDAEDNDLEATKIGLMGRVLMQVGAFGEPFAAEVLDHKAPRPSAPAQGVTAEYGEYLVNTGDCSACHGPDLSGSQSPEPGAPYSPNLTPGGVMEIWTPEDFIQTMRTGITPYGRELDPKYMPWKEYGLMTDEDLTAMFLYLESLTALDGNNK